MRREHEGHGMHLHCIQPCRDCRECSAALVGKGQSARLSAGLQDQLEGHDGSENQLAERDHVLQRERLQNCADPPYSLAAKG